MSGGDGWLRHRERCLLGPSHLCVAQGLSLHSQNVAATPPPSEKPLVASSRHLPEINSFLQDLRTNLHFSVAEERGV